MKIRILRYAILSAVFAMVVYLALGYSSRSFEAYCPFGGVESLWGLITEGQFTCALGPLNLSLMIAVIALTLVAKKSFCGWVCPIGFLGELFGKIGLKTIGNRPKMDGKLNDRLKLLRYIVLIVALLFTFYTGELILRGYDPFYVLFSGFGHGTLGLVTFITISIIFLGSFLIPMLFCRYLCPLGATLDPFSRIGLIKVSRNAERCDLCGECKKSCPHDIAPHETDTIRHRDCTNCLECLEACPNDGVLSLNMRL